MGRRNAHRARAGGRREFFARMMREHPEYGAFDPSAFPPPLITPPSSPEEVWDVPASEGTPLPKRLSARTSEGNPPRSRKTPKRPSDFIPARAPTRPVPPSVGARRPAKLEKETDPTSTRILGSVYPNFEIHKTPQGLIVTIST